MNATGESGHSSILFSDTAAEKLNFAMNKFLELRKNESRKLDELNLPYGNVTVINFTELRGGIKLNIVPPKLSFFVDMRIAADADWDDLENKVWLFATFSKTNVLICPSFSCLNLQLPCTWQNEI